MDSESHLMIEVRFFHWVNRPFVPFPGQEDFFARRKEEILPDQHRPS
jgi:hypothetical protein